MTDYTVEIISLQEKQTPHQYLAKTEKKKIFKITENIYRKEIDF